MLSKFRCCYCKKIVWPWQCQYLGCTKAHAICDAEELIRTIEELHHKYPKYFTEENVINVLDNMHKRYY